RRTALGAADLQRARLSRQRARRHDRRRAHRALAARARAARVLPAPPGRGARAQRDPAPGVRLRLRARHEPRERPHREPPPQARDARGRDRNGAGHRLPPARRGAGRLVKNPHTLPRRLALWLCGMTLVGLAVFTAAAYVVVYLEEEADVAQGVET